MFSQSSPALVWFCFWRRNFCYVINNSLLFHLRCYIRIWMLILLYIICGILSSAWESEGNRLWCTFCIKLCFSRGNVFTRSNTAFVRFWLRLSNYCNVFENYVLFHHRYYIRTWVLLMFMLSVVFYFPPKNLYEMEFGVPFT